jgi:hypothetical protein
MLAVGEGGVLVARFFAVEALAAGTAAFRVAVVCFGFAGASVTTAAAEATGSGAAGVSSVGAGSADVEWLATKSLMKRRISRAALVSSVSQRSTKVSRSTFSTRMASWLVFLPAFFFFSAFLLFAFGMTRASLIKSV